MSRPRPAARSLPRLEALESRRLLSADVPAGPGFAALPGLKVDSTRYATDHILVRYRGAEAPGSPELGIVPGLTKLAAPAGFSIEGVLAALRTSPDVLYAEPDYQVSLEAMPNDPSFNLQWPLRNTAKPGADIGAVGAWDVTTGGAGQIVAIIDTGVDYTHPDLTANIWTNPGEIAGNDVDDDGNGYVDDIHGYDFINGDGDPMDDHGHGTHVAGTIGAVGDNGVGVAGVVWGDIKLMALKFLGSNGNGSTSDAIAALGYAVANGATISNNSWGGDEDDPALAEAITNAGAAGHIFVAAAGNAAKDLNTKTFYPASYHLDNMIVVAASDSNDKLASFSNYGTNVVDLAAPGVNILSTARGGGYVRMSGTSMATPHVVGAAALLRGLHPDWTYRQVIDRLLATVDPVSAGVKTISGGRLDLAAAVKPADTGTDLRIVSAVATGDSVTLTYQIANAASPAFNVSVFRSTDNDYSSNDTPTGDVAITDPAALTVGTHTQTLTIGGDSGQLALPGAGAAEVDTDYRLLVVLDPNDMIFETDADPFAEDNTAALSGVYALPGGPVCVLGTSDEDTATVSLGATLQVVFNGAAYDFTPAAVDSVRVRLGNGNDTVEIGSNIPGGTRAFGGAGGDTWRLIGTAAKDVISVAKDGPAGWLRATRGAQIDRFAYDGSDHIVIEGDAGNDRISIASSVTIGATLNGGGGNDALTGGGGRDELNGGDDSDTLNGGLGNDTIDGGGGGTDQAFVDGTSGNDFLAATWDSALSRLVTTRRSSAGGAVLESDRLTGSELFLLRGLAGNDQLDLSGLDTAGSTAGGVRYRTLDGGTGNDVLIGSDAGDTLRGGGGDDTLDGGAGNDNLNGGAGADLWTIQGTSADDLLIVSTLSATRWKSTRAAVSAPAPILETDQFTFDAADQISLQGGDGDDDLRASVANPGTAEGGDGDDVYDVPGNWTIID